MTAGLFTRFVSLPPSLSFRRQAVNPRAPLVSHPPRFVDPIVSVLQHLVKSSNVERCPKPSDPDYCPNWFAHASAYTTPKP